MRTRILGKTDLQLTTVGLGTWAIGGPWQYGWGPQDDNDSITAIHEALDQGINWIDLAYENPRACQSACQTCSFAARLSFAGSSGRVISLLLTVINRLSTNTYKTP